MEESKTQEATRQSFTIHVANRNFFFLKVTYVLSTLTGTLRSVDCKFRAKVKTQTNTGTATIWRRLERLRRDGKRERKTVPETWEGAELSTTLTGILTLVDRSNYRICLFLRLLLVLRLWKFTAFAFSPSSSRKTENCPEGDWFPAHLQFDRALDQKRPGPLTLMFLKTLSVCYRNLP